MTLFYVAIGGALGAVSRYVLTGWVHGFVKGDFPYGTLTVNLLGSFILGFFTALALDKPAIINANLRIAFTIGFIGALTTFSTFSYETFKLLEEGEILLAGINAFGTMALGLLFLWIGVVLGRIF